MASSTRLYAVAPPPFLIADNQISAGTFLDCSGAPTSLISQNFFTVYYRLYGTDSAALPVPPDEVLTHSPFNGLDPPAMNITNNKIIGKPRKNGGEQ